MAGTTKALTPYHRHDPTTSSYRCIQYLLLRSCSLHEGHNLAHPNRWDRKFPRQGFDMRRWLRYKWYLGYNCIFGRYIPIQCPCHIGRSSHNLRHDLTERHKDSRAQIGSKLWRNWKKLNFLVATFWNDFDYWDQCRVVNVFRLYIHFNFQPNVEWLSIIDNQLVIR